ncbi:MAG: ion transporter [Nannocystales bacterium]
MVEILRKVSNASWFTQFITGVILLAGVIVGLETYPGIVEEWGGALHGANLLILIIFTIEVAVKMGAEGSKPWRYFRDPWNIFDFLIVVAAYLPIDAQFITVLRLARVLRVLKLVRALPKLQIIVSALLKSIPSMGYVSLLLLLLFYLFAVTGTFLFGENDPVHFRNLQLSMLTLFRVVTLEDWTDVMYIQMYGCEGYGYGGMEHLCTKSAAHPVFGAGFFVTFVLIGTMIVLNLFVGVIMSGMEEAQREQELLRELEDRPTSVQSDVRDLLKQTVALQASLERLQAQVKIQEEGKL